MVRYLITCCALLVLLTHTVFASSYYWNGGASGDWNTAGNWKVGYPGGSTAGVAPTAGDDVILNDAYVSGSYLVTLNGAPSGNCKSLTIGYAGNSNTITFQIPAANTQGPALTIANPASAADTFVIESGGVYDDSGSGVSPVIAHGANCRSHVKSGGTFSHNSSAWSGAWPIGDTSGGGITFDSGSTMDWAGSGGFGISGRTFGNLKLSGATAFTAPTIGSSNTIVTVLNTLTIGSGATLNANYINSANGSWRIHDIVNNGNGGTWTFGVGNGNGGLILNGSTISGSSATPITFTTGAASNFIETSGTVTLNSKIAVGAPTTLTVAAGSTLNIGSNAITGAGGFTLAAGATLGIADAAGITASGATGAVQAGARSFATGATYVYNGSAAQVTGAGLPASFSNLTINNGAGVTLSANANVTTTLGLAAGVLNSNGNTLTIPDGGAAFTHGAGYVMGTLTRAINAAATGARNFPVGTADGASTVTLDVTSGSGTGTFAVTATQTAAPNIVDSAHVLAKYWTLTPSGVSGFTATLTFAYQAADVPGTATEANFVAGRYAGPGTNWSEFPATVINTGAHTATVTGVTSFSPWSLGESGALPVELSDFSVE